MRSRKKGKHSQQPALQERKPVIQIDFARMSTKEQLGTSVTILTGIDFRTQVAIAASVPSKSMNRYGLTTLKRFIYEPGRTHSILQCEDESLTAEVRRVAIKDIGGLTGRLAPTGSSQSPGSVERWHQTLCNQVRAVRLAPVNRLHLHLADLLVIHPFHAVDSQTCRMASQ